MAFRPSFRRRHEDEEVEPNLTPIMNLMVVLIPLLLTSAEFIKLSVIELNLPPTSGPIQQTMELPKEQTKKLELTVSITGDGFYISNALDSRDAENAVEPAIPLKADGSYNFARLSEVLLQIKEQAEGKFSDLQTIIIKAEANVSYQALVSTMDASRSVRIGNRKISLFPEVSLSAGVIDKA